MSKLKLPKTICIKVQSDESGPDYFVAGEEVDELIDGIGEKVQVGVYRLVETKTVEGIVEVSNKRTIA